MSPKRPLSVGAAALNLIPLDFSHNSRLVESAIEVARSRKIDLLCLPELSLTGYGCEDGFFYPHIRLQALEMLRALLPKTQDIAVALGLPLEVEGILYNAIAFVSDKKLLGFVCKKHLAGYGIHYEPRWFTPWPEGVLKEISFFGDTVPCGDQTFTIKDNVIAFEICEDAWVKDRPGIRLAEKGVDVILNPSASHFGLHKVDVRRELVLEGSKKYSPLYVYANILGNEGGRIIYDGDTLIAQNGKLIGQGKRFSFHDFILTESSYTPPPWELSVDRDFEEFTRAVSIGLFDYLRKSKAYGFVLSLSGGADSASIAVLIRCMCALGVHELGLDGFKDKLSYIPTLSSAKNISECIRALLTCVYQATENSSQTTKNAAEVVAKELNASFTSISIGEIVDGYLSTFEGATGKLTWERDDLALQNIQARVRSPGIWLLANVKRALLLTTSNRSEAAVGYATMDGDTSGSLAPIAGIDKYFIQRWLSWMQSTGIAETGPMPFLSVIIQQAPTAELRPLVSKQTDEKDLMPYKVLSVIEKEILYNRTAPKDAILKVKEQYGDEFSKEEIETWISKFLKLWSMSQWKRERYAPSFHLDEFNIDPRSWFRFPILSGGL